MMVIKASPEESLLDHINVALVFYKYLYTRLRYGKFLAKRAKILGFNVLEDLDVLPQLALLLHDVGKAYQPLQTCVSTEGRAGYHEYVSLVASSKILRIHKLVDNPVFFKDAILLSIIWHHTAIRGAELIGREERISNVLRYCARKAGMEERTHYLLEECQWKELIYILSEISQNYGLGGYLHLEDLPMEISIEEIIKFSEELAERLTSREGGSVLYFYTLLLLHPLITCDNYSASVNRGGRAVRFLIDLPTLREIIHVRDALKFLLTKGKTRTFKGA